MSPPPLSELLERYDVPVPRYTSYPPVPHWQDVPPLDRWTRALADALDSDDASLSLYVHVPFCETLCTFCGCNTVITRNHDRGDAYVDVVLAEIDTYLRHLPALADRPLAQLHLGGGTPTFLRPEALARLLREVGRRVPGRAAGFEGAIEVDPRVTSDAHLEVLRAAGIGRISLGVQDVDPDVLRIVNRPQPVAVTERLVGAARRLGFESLNIDLIYGLPKQTPEGMARLADAVLRLSPDRLAVYSFARVPWIKPAQRKFSDDDVPAGAAKRALYEVLRTRLLDAGYVEIGLDHFALPHDALARAARDGTLHRNFMGYTDRRTSALLGVGVSAISETPACHHQNEKVIAVYERRVAAGEIPTLRGHLLSDDDRRRGARIRQLMATGRTAIDAEEAADARVWLAPLIEDGLVVVGADALSLTATGVPFMRNVAAFFDVYLRRAAPASPTYSRAI
jgi:oxygen-independent coproporphyrinogen III oxidase